MKVFHETDEQLELFALDRLPEAAVERVEEHLMICDSCRMRLSDIGEFAHSMRESLRAAPLGPVPRRVGWFEGWNLKLAFGAAVACALVIAFVTWRGGNALNLAPVATLTLSAMRGESAVIPQAMQLDLTLAGASGQHLSVEVVDATGKRRWSGTADAADGVVRTTIDQVFAPGTYFVRLRSPAGDLLHEYGFQVRP